MEANPTNPYSAPVANLYGAPAVGVVDGVSPSTVAQLAKTKPWVRFLSVMAWIGVFFMLLAAGGMGIASAVGAAKSMPGPMGAYPFGILAVVYGVLSFFYMYPAIKLWKYASRIKELCAMPTVASLDAALNEQRAFWKYLGVLMIVMLSAYAIFIIGLIFVAVSTGMKNGGMH